MVVHGGGLPALGEGVRAPGSRGPDLRRRERRGRAGAAWSLGHADRDRARDFADEAAREIRRGSFGAEGEPATLGQTFKLYRKHQSPEKSKGEQKADARRAEMFRRLLGPDFELAKLSRREWDAFVRDRRSGAIDPRGQRVPNPKNRRPVGARTVEADLK